MSESKLYDVPADVAANAYINEDKYNEMYQRSIADPEGFWAEQAEEFIDWFKPWNKVWDWDYEKANIAWFRKEIFGDTIIVRSRRPGDFFRPSGGGGKCRIKDYFIDEKIPASKRNSIPLLEVTGEIIWVVGYRIAEGVSAVPGGESISVYIT